MEERGRDREEERGGERWRVDRDKNLRMMKITKCTQVRKHTVVAFQL